MANSLKPVVGHTDSTLLIFKYLFLPVRNPRQCYDYLLLVINNIVFSISRVAAAIFPAALGLAANLVLEKTLSVKFDSAKWLFVT